MQCISSFADEHLPGTLSRSPLLDNFVALLVVVNCAVDPILFSLLDSTLRRALARRFSCCARLRVVGVDALLSPQQQHVPHVTGRPGLAFMELGDPDKPTNGKDSPVHGGSAELAGASPTAKSALLSGRQRGLGRNAAGSMSPDRERTPPGGSPSPVRAMASGTGGAVSIGIGIGPSSRGSVVGGASATQPARTHSPQLLAQHSSGSPTRGASGTRTIGPPPMQPAVERARAGSDAGSRLTVGGGGGGQATALSLLTSESTAARRNSGQSSAISSGDRSLDLLLHQFGLSPKRVIPGCRRGGREPVGQPDDSLRCRGRHRDPNHGRAAAGAGAGRALGSVLDRSLSGRAWRRRGALV